MFFSRLRRSTPIDSGDRFTILDPNKRSLRSRDWFHNPHLFLRDYEPRNHSFIRPRSVYLPLPPSRRSASRSVARSSSRTNCSLLLSARGRSPPHPTTVLSVLSVILFLAACLSFSLLSSPLLSSPLLSALVSVSRRCAFLQKQPLVSYLPGKLVTAGAEISRNSRWKFNVETRIDSRILVIESNSARWIHEATQTRVLGPGHRSSTTNSLNAPEITRETDKMARLGTSRLHELLFEIKSRWSVSSCFFEA